MKIIVDAMGGDNAPGEIIRGALRAAEEFQVGIVLVGQGEAILQALKDQGLQDLPKNVEVAHASQVITMEDDPAAAIREKKDSSIVVGLKMLAAGGGDALVSAGSTGALLSGATLTVKRVRGIRRAALAPVLPTARGGALLVDSGANVECTPEYMLQFAYMGHFYAHKVMGMESPRVGLLNIGTEETKGGQLQRETYKLLEEARQAGRMNFVGNIEGRDVALGGADVIVADGFSGNVLLKTMEGVGLFFLQNIKKMLTANLKTKLAAAALKDQLGEFKKLMDYKETGGAPLLGIAKPVIKAHGSSDAFALRSAVKQAVQFAGSGMIQVLTDNMEHLKVPAPLDNGEKA